MGGNTWRWLTSHRKMAVAIALLIGFIAANGFAFVHAYAMTHFAVGGERTLPPEKLTKAQKLKVLLTGVRLPRPTNRRNPSSEGLSFDVHSFNGTDGTTYEGWYVPARGDITDARKLVLMFHGYGSSKADMLPAARALHQLGYGLFLVDFRGSGGSSGQVTTIGFREADDVIEAFHYASAHFPAHHTTLYGESMGGAAILRAVGVKGLKPDAIFIECTFDRLLSTVENRFHAMHMPAFPLAELLVFWGGVQQGYWGFVHNPAEYAKHVDCPALVLHGDLDPRVTRAQADAVYDALPGSKRFFVFEGAGHESYVVKQPETWSKVVGGFLTSGARAMQAGPASRLVR